MSLIIKGTSIFKSNYRALKRDIHNNEQNMDSKEKRSLKYKFDVIKTIVNRYLNNKNTFNEKQLKNIKKKNIVKSEFK